MSFIRWPQTLLVGGILLWVTAITTPAYADPPDELRASTPEPVAPSEPANVLGMPRAPNLPSNIARQFASLEFEERELAREANWIETDRTLTIALYIGGIGLTIGSVAMLVSAVLQSTCVSEEFGCYSAREFITGGIPVALVGGILISGAALTDARVGIRERALETRRESLEERRRTLERRVGLALGPGSLELRITF